MSKNSSIYEKLKSSSYVTTHLETRIASRKAIMASNKNYVYISINNQHCDFDWVVTFAVRIDDDRCVIVTTDLVSAYMQWLTRPGDLWDIRMSSEHENFVCEPVDSLLGIEEERTFPLYVITTSSHEGGGGVFLHPSIQDRLHNLFPNGHFLILSSRHEALACPKDLGLAQGVADIFHELNARDDVTPMMDRVTDDVYYCNKPYVFGKVSSLCSK